MQITIAQFEAACAALGLNAATTLSVNLAPTWVRIVHTDQAVTSIAVSVPESEPV